MVKILKKWTEIDAGDIFKNINCEENDLTHTAEWDNDTIYLVWEWIKIYWEIVDWKKIVRFDLVSYIKKKCYNINSDNDDKREWYTWSDDTDDSKQNWWVTEVYLNWLKQWEWDNYITKDYHIVVEDWLIQDWDTLCLVYPTSEEESKWIWAMEIWNNFIIS